MYPCNFHTYTERTSTITIKQVHQYFWVAMKPMSSLTISLNKIVINSADTKYIHILLAKNPVQSADRYMSNTLGSTSKHLVADSRRDDTARCLDAPSESLKGYLSIDATLPSMGFFVIVSPSTECNFVEWNLNASAPDILLPISAIE
jgi:hypothetical protein